MATLCDRLLVPILLDQLRTICHIVLPHVMLSTIASEAHVTLERVTSTKRSHKQKTFCAVCVVTRRRGERDSPRPFFCSHTLVIAVRQDNTSLIRW